MTWCFYCRKQFDNLDESHTHAFGLTSDAKPQCSKMSLEQIIRMDANDRWFNA